VRSSVDSNNVVSSLLLSSLSRSVFFDDCFQVSFVIFQATRAQLETNYEEHKGRFSV
jgi:hypothetical protein